MVIWKDPSAKDDNGKDIDAICMPPSGSEFSIGKTEVVCMTGDGDRENNTCTFFVTVKGT